MKDIIVNGKFTSQTGVFSTDSWIFHNVSLTPPENPYLDTLFYVEGKSGTYPFNTVPPGIYQKINISDNYEQGAKINFKYTISYKSEIALQRKENLSAYFYIYRIDPNYSGNIISPFGNVRTCTYKESVSIRYSEYDASQSAILTKEDEVKITLYPGDYVIGFGADYVGTSVSFMSDANKITGLGITSIEGLIENVPASEDGLPYKTKDFIGLGAETVVLTPDNNYYLPVERDTMDIGIKCPKNATLDQQKQRKEGLGADFDIEQFTNEGPERLSYTGKISFWYRCDPGITGKFAIYVYERDLGTQWFYEEITATEYWSFCSKEIDLWDGKFEILIIPPKNTSTSTKDKFLIVNNIDFSLRIVSKANGVYPPPGEGGDGTYSNPYNENDGYVGYDVKVNGSEVSYIPKFVTDMPLKSQVYYVRIKNKHYMTKGTKTHYLCADGFYDINGTFLEDPKGNLVNFRYFQKNGEITKNEYFCVNGEDIYIADEIGLCYYSCQILKSMSLSINNLPITGKEIIDIPRDKNQFITATFEEQTPSILLSIKSSDESVIKCISVDKNIYGDDFGGYGSNKSNTLTILGVKTGIATITVSYESITGSIVENSFIMEVRDTNEYPSSLEIDLSYRDNYIVYGQEYKVKYRVRPIISSDLPLYWYVDRNDLFSITNDGVIRVKDGVGQPEDTLTANITIINYGSGIVENCRVHFLPSSSSLKVPTKVKITENGIDQTSKTYVMTVGDKVDFRDETLSSNGSSVNVYQNVKWYSSNSSIAMVDQYGTITALKEGNVNITCSCQQDSYLAGIVRVEVKPDEDSLILQKIELNTSKIVIFNSEDESSNRYSQEYLSCIYTPSNTRQTGVVWSSDDPSIAKVDESGRVYCDPVSSNNKKSTTIRCTSIYNKNITASCEVTTYNWESYKPIIWLSEHNFKAAMYQQTVIRYALSNCDYIEYVENSLNVEIKRWDDGFQTINEATYNERDQKIFLDIKETGTFRITISIQYKKLGDDTTYYITDTCKLEAIRGTYQPTVTKDLEILYTLHDHSYVLRYNAVNEVAENFEFYLNIDGNESLVFAEPLIYGGERYFYIFEKMDYPGDFKVSVKVKNYNNGNYYMETTKEVIVTIPENEDNKQTLKAAKQDYDKATDDIINYIGPLIMDDAITADEQAEFITRFKLFNVNYENMKIALDMCIDYIDEQIKAAQAEMSLMATNLNSGGIQMAAYSIEENTNSNYSNVTDMDYYQNECIKALMQRILELEARLDDISNNNN